MIDFTNAIQRNKAYAGANGGKIAVMYNDEQYMLKFPPYPTKNKDMSYTNSCISEYIGCKIFELLDIPVQETMIGKYTSKGKTKIVVACKDFTKPGVVLQDFAVSKVFGQEKNKRKRKIKITKRDKFNILESLLMKKSADFFIKKLGDAKNGYR